MGTRLCTEWENNFPTQLQCTVLISYYLEWILELGLCIFGFWNLVLAFFNFPFLNLTSLLNWSILKNVFLISGTVCSLRSSWQSYFSPKYGQNSGLATLVHW